MKLLALAVVAIGLSGCASQATWNTDLFPEQPTYGSAAATVPVAEVAKR